jgi:hypothetical protein
MGSSQKLSSSTKLRLEIVNSRKLKAGAEEREKRQGVSVIA